MPELIIPVLKYVIPAKAGLHNFLVPMLLRGNLRAALEWLLLERQVCILTRKRGNEEEWRHSREGGNPHSREGENLRHLGPLCSPYSTTFLVPMLLRGNLWVVLEWLLLERQVCIPTRERGNEKQVCILTRKRGNEEEWRHSREGENLRHMGPLCSPYSTTFLVPMLLRGHLWAALGWLLLERQVCIPTRERGNEEREET